MVFLYRGTGVESHLDMKYGFRLGSLILFITRGWRFNVSPAQRFAIDKRKRIRLNKKVKAPKQRKIIFKTEIENCLVATGLTKTDLSAVLGTTRFALLRIIKGYGCNLQTALRVAKFFGLKVDDLWKLTGK